MELDCDKSAKDRQGYRMENYYILEETDQESNKVGSGDSIEMYHNSHRYRSVVCLLVGTRDI